MGSGPSVPQDRTKPIGGNGENWQCAPATLEIDLKGKVYAVTGGYGGIGLGVSTQLAKQGAKVYILGRSETKYAAGAASIKKEVGEQADVEFVKLDLADLASIRACASELDKKLGRLDGLLNNAAVGVCPQQKTKDGFELQFGTNHLGPFLLTELLLPKLIETKGSRIVNTSSAGHAAYKLMGVDEKDSVIDFDDLMFEKKEYNQISAYGQSKLANILHANYLAKLMKEQKHDVTVVSLHPGFVVTDLVRHVAPKWIFSFMKLFRKDMMGLYHGAQTSLHCLLDPSVASLSGQFFSQTGPYTDEKSRAGGLPMKSPNPNAYDEAMAAKLYEVSRKLVGLNK